MIRNALVELGGEVQAHAVRQMAAMGEIHRQDGVARVKQRAVNGGVGLRARVRLDVGVIGAEQLLRACYSKSLNDVDVPASAAVALTRIAFRELVHEYRTLRLDDRRMGVVLRRNHTQGGFLASQLSRECFGDLRIDLRHFSVKYFVRNLRNEHGAS
jgi:hypothetical protein